MSEIQIPKVIHQIWVGDREIPDHCKAFVEQMKALHPDWEHHLWGNEIFSTIFSEDRFLQSYLKNPKLYKWAFISDRIRLLLLRDFGGIYVDVDAKPVQSFNLVRDQLSPQITFLSGLKSSQSTNTLVDCTVYGAAPQARIVLECLSCYKSLTWAHGGKTFSEKIIQQMGPDVALFGYEYFYNSEVNEKTVVLHDVLESRLFSWVDEEKKAAGEIEM